MDSKTLGTIIVVFLCVLFFPVAIGIIGGFFGLLGGLLGGFFGVIGGLLSGIFGWIFGGHFQGYWPFRIFHWNPVSLAILLLVILLIARSKTSGSRK